MDQLGEIVRLNDDKLYSQLINYKYRSKNVNGQANKEDLDEENIDDLDEENLNKKDRKHKYRKNRIKFKKLKKINKFDSLSNNLMVDKIKDYKTDSNDDKDVNSVNNVNNRNSLVIDLDVINKLNESNDKKANRTNKWSKENDESDELQDYENYLIDYKQDNNSLSMNLNNNLNNNLTYETGKDEFDDYENSVEIINLSIDDQIKNRTSNFSDNLIEYLDNENLLISSKSNRLVLEKLNQTNWLLERNGQNETINLDSNLLNNTDSSFYQTKQSKDSNEQEFIYELDLLDNGAIDFDYSQLASNRQILNDQKIINKKLIDSRINLTINQPLQHNQLIDNQLVDLPKFAHLTSSSTNFNLTANATIISTVATLTNKLLLNLSAPSNSSFTNNFPNLNNFNNTGAYNSSFLNNSHPILATSKPPTPPPFSYWLTILIAVLIAIASLITITGNLLVSILFYSILFFFNFFF